MDFIITSLQSWDIEIGSTIKNTAAEIAKEHRVLFVNPAMDIATRLRSGKSPHHQLRHVCPNLWVLDLPCILHSVGQLPSWLFRPLNRANNRTIGKHIVQTARQLGFHDYIHLIDTDLFRSVHLKEYIRPALSIYYRRDYVIGFPYWRKNGPRCEESLVRQADIVLTNSALFAEQLRPWNPHVHVLNTGVNLERYNADLSYEIPEDLQSLPRPIVGYTGAILQERLDSQLLYDIASRLSDCHFVLVGPEDDHFRQHPLHQLPNVHFLGHKPPAQLPAYIRHFDVCINPQVVNEITDGNYPLKIDEYLAMGRPVVATSTHTMRQVFSAYVYLPRTATEYVTAIRKALTEAHQPEKEQQRIAFAHTHSWANSVKVIYQAIRTMKNEERRM